MMDKKLERRKSIVNGHHMKDVQQKIDSEYKAHLRHKERVRENTERLREKRVGSQQIPNLLNTYSMRRYSKPWRNGMTTKTEIPTVPGLEERQRQYKSTVFKLPAINNDKEVMSKKTLSNPGTAQQTHKLITVSQPRITVEKKKLHVHQLSAKPSVTRVAEEKARSKNEPKLQSKEPKKPANHQKQTLMEKKFTKGANNELNLTQPPYVEQDMVLRFDVNHHNTASSPPSNSHDLTEEPQTTTRPSSSRWSHLQEPEDVFNWQPQEDDTLDEDDRSYVSDITLPLTIPTRAQTSNTSLIQLHTAVSDFTDSAEENSGYSDNEELSRTYRHNDEVNTEISHSTLRDLDMSTRNSSYFGRTNLGQLQTPRRLQGISPAVTEVADQSQTSPRNPTDTLEVPRINVPITLSQNDEISTNTVVQNRENYDLPHTTFRDSGDRERDSLLGAYSAVPNAAAPLRLSVPSIAPNIALLHENLDLVFHTLSMQRQSQRRDLENTVSTSQNKEAEKPKTDPEKLKKLQESLLQEESEEEGDLCRICLMGVETTENHLIAPCQCSGSLKYVHTECIKKWLLAKIKSGAELNTVIICEMCKQKVECEIEGFNLSEHYRKHQETQATLNPSLYLVLLLHLYQQRYEELLQLSNTRDRVSELSRRFSHLSLGRREHSRDNEQDS
ncbi:putative E3 ubiquitin-protein ligase MARCHF10 isoform X1 [Rhinoderma darwinii]|uniref:putative E3 ubiquitin-protein ligase MARCHF10 isoform X1 n=2 Tax=Rhinoderma darwinii TaxID=43563 RepID=UPI003F665624